MTAIADASIRSVAGSAWNRIRIPIVASRYVDIAIRIAAVAAGLWLLHRFLSYAENRGWIYYRKKRGSYGGLGVTSTFLNMYDPSRKHLQEVVREQEWKRDEDDDGDRPGDGSRPARHSR
jgi:hypothetical protein